MYAYNFKGDYGFSTFIPSTALDVNGFCGIVLRHYDDDTWAK